LWALDAPPQVLKPLASSPAPILAYPKSLLHSSYAIKDPGLIIMPIMRGS